jgi:hypothetical protein
MTSVVDQHRFNANPHSEPNFHSVANVDPDQHQTDANPYHCITLPACMSIACLLPSCCPPVSHCLPACLSPVFFPAVARLYHTACLHVYRLSSSQLLPACFTLPACMFILDSIACCRVVTRLYKIEKKVSLLFRPLRQESSTGESSTPATSVHLHYLKCIFVQCGCPTFRNLYLVSFSF